MFGEEIAYPWLCDDEYPPAGIFFNLFSQPPYMYFQAIGGTRVIITPNCFGNTGMSYNVACISHQVAKDAGFSNSEMNFLIVAIEVTRDSIQL